MNEYSWKELSKLFEELSSKLYGARIDFEWGSVPKRATLVGCGDVILKDKFYALSKIAGKKLMNVINKNDYSELKEIKDPISFWFYSLKVFSKRFEFDFQAEETDGKLNKTGIIYLGRIMSVAEVSSNMCLTFYNQFPDDKN